MKHLDKVKHLAVFSGGYFLVLATLDNFVFGNLAYAILLANLVLAITAFVTEDAQRKQPGRVKDGWDAFADMLASVVGLGAYLVAQPFIHTVLGKL